MKTLLILTLLSLGLPIFGQVTTDPTTPTTDVSDGETNPTPGDTSLPSELLNRINNTLYDEWEDAGTKLSASIFESLTDRELFQEKVIGDLSVSLRVQRRAFNNQDILDTWTVVDIMRIPFHLPIPLFSDEIGFGAGGVGLNMGLSFGADSYHIRQVVPESYDKLTSLSKLEESIDEAKQESDALYNEVQDQDLDFDIIDEDDADDSALSGLSRLLFWKSQNPRIRARYNKLWNLITHPLKMPLTAKRMDEYPVGEISSYGLNGGVQLGLRAGWSQFEIAGLDLTATQASLGITTYLRGNFSISLWKESKQHAQVKLTRSFSSGRNYNLGHLSLTQELFEGFMVLDRNILKIKEQFIPFSFNVNKSMVEKFAIAYRYDLSKEGAREAYELATLGRFKKSFDLATDPESGVEETFMQNSVTDTESETYRMKLSLLFEKSSGNSQATTKATVHMDGKEHKLFSSKSLVFKSYDSLWGSNESKRHEFSTTLNENTFNENETKGLGMRIIARIEDSHTNGEELNDYIDEVEAAIKRPGSFPRPPVYLPNISCDQLEEMHNGRDYEASNCNELPRKAEYGRTSFYYQVDLDLNHLKNIQNATNKDFWRAMEIAFNREEGEWSKTHRRLFSLTLNSYATVLNLPLTLLNLNIDKGGRLILAYRFYRQWKKLKKIEDPRELVKAFGKLYDTIHYGSQLVIATRILAGDAQANFSMTASAADVWGKLSSSEGSLDNVFPIGNEVERRSTFDRIGPRINVDADAQILKLEIKKIDENTAKIIFNLKEVPRFLYVRVDRTSSWNRYQNLLKVIVNNEGQIKKGLNEIVVKRTDTQGLNGKLKKAIFNGKQSHLMLSYAIDGDGFGAVASAKFRFDEDQEEEEEDDSFLFFN